MSSITLMEMLVITILLISAATAFYVIRKRVRAINEFSRLTIPEFLPTEGLNIPVMETCTGIKGTAVISILQNDFNPKLILYDTHMEFRVFALRSVDYSQIKSIREVPFFFIKYLQFIFNDRTFTLNVSLASRETSNQLADFFRRKGIAVHTGS